MVDGDYELTDTVEISSSDAFGPIAARILTACSDDRHHRRRRTSTDWSPFAAALTNNEIHVYRGESRLTKTATFAGHTKMITGIKFSHTESNVLYSCSEDGSLRLWDLRQSKEARKLFDDSGKRPKPICSFDVNCSEKYACCGTSLIKQDAFLLFWDLRASKLLGGYWESHTDDITTVRFRPEDQNCVASGSVDGLINVFDISQPTEDDALVTTINTESSVDLLRWCHQEFAKISCVTHMETLQLWDIEEISRLKTVTRENIGSKFQSIEAPKFVALEVGRDGTLGIVTTSKTGDAFLVGVDTKSATLTAHGTVLSRGRSEPILAASWNTEDLLTTCDEGGRLCIWRRRSSDHHHHQPATSENDSLEMNCSDGGRRTTTRSKR